MTEDDGIPTWARPLVRGPIEVGDGTTHEDLATELGDRLEALLRLYNCDASADGWRSLALRLALDHEIVAGQPAMRVVAPVDRQAETGGIEPGKRWWLAKRLKKRAADLGSVKAAAKELSKTEGLSMGRLQNLSSDEKAGRVSKPREMQRRPWDEWIASALRTAADRLDADHKPRRLSS